jgi:hypothetical protein
LRTVLHQYLKGDPNRIRQALLNLSARQPSLRSTDGDPKPSRSRSDTGSPTLAAAQQADEEKYSAIDRLARSMQGRAAFVTVVNFNNCKCWKWGKIACGGPLVMTPLAVFSRVAGRSAEQQAAANRDGSH